MLLGNRAALRGRLTFILQQNPKKPLKERMRFAAVYYYHNEKLVYATAGIDD
jgi:hypothetical protein